MRRLMCLEKRTARPRRKSERRTTTHSDQTCQIAGPMEWMQERWLPLQLHKTRDQVSPHDVRLLKVKTDQCEIGEPSGKQRTRREINPVSLRQVSCREGLSNAFFQFVRPRVK